MQCRMHPSEKGVNTCNQCGSWLCESCTITREGRNFCPTCASQWFAPPPPAPAPRVSRPVPPPFAAHHSSTELPPPYIMPPPTRATNGFVLFLVSFFTPPGINLMYMGFVKRGLVALSAFFVLTYMMIQFYMSGMWQLGMLATFSMPVLWLGIIFDGFSRRRRLIAGEELNDDVDDVLEFIKRNKKMFIICLVLVFALSLTGTVLSSIAWLTSAISRFIPLIILFVVIRMLFKKNR